MLRIPKDKALSLLQTNLDQIPHGPDPNNPFVLGWQRATLTDIATIFGEDSRAASDFSSIRWDTGLSPQLICAMTENDLDEAQREAANRGRMQAGAILAALIRRVLAEPDPTPAILSTLARTRATRPEHPANRVFIVHGHDTGPKNAVARAVKTLGLQEIVLHEQVDKGRTIIEKFEDESVADLAVVLATPDDLAGTATALQSSSGSIGAEQLRGRARQNVIFELGYFVAKLGRHRVLLITDKSVEIPSDFFGVLWADRSNWQQKLIDVVCDAGYEHKLTAKQIREVQAMQF